MKKFIALISFFAVGICAVFAAPAVPLNSRQFIYIDPNGHSVPLVISNPQSGTITAIFDPSTSATDQANAFSYLQQAVSGIGGQLQLQVQPAVVNTGFRSQVTRTTVPFAVTASTTLQTIPFSVATTLETNGHYTFRAVLYVNVGAGGSKIDVGGTCNTSNFVAQYKAISTTSIVYGGQLTAFLSGPSGSGTAVKQIVVEGELDVTNGGTFVIQFAQNGSDASASTVLAGSTLTVTQIP